MMHAVTEQLTARRATLPDQIQRGDKKQADKLKQNEKQKVTLPHSVPQHPPAYQCW